MENGEKVSKWRKNVSGIVWTVIEHLINIRQFKVDFFFILSFFLYLFIHLFVCLFIYLFIHFFIYLFTYFIVYSRFDVVNTKLRWLKK